MFNLKSCQILLTIIGTYLVFASQASAQVAFGQGFTCVGNQIINAKGRTQRFSSFKNKINDKIDATKSALNLAKMRKQRSRISSLTESLNSQKAILQSGKSCSKGTLIDTPTPVATPTPDNNHGRPDKDKGGPKGRR